MVTNRAGLEDVEILVSAQRNLEEKVHRDEARPPSNHDSTRRRVAVGLQEGQDAQVELETGKLR